jgi:peptide/nickel transport system ATP-binding protein
MSNHNGASHDLLINVENLRTYFFLDEGTVRAVDGADFAIKRGQTMGIVGESGCGKSVTARSILRIVARPGRIVSGTITFYRTAQVKGGTTITEEVKLTDLDPRGREIRSIRGAEIALVPQEPMTALSQLYTIGNQIVEAITLHQGCSEKEGRERATAILKLVGMPQAEQALDRYPYQLSGGMRQRAVIAMALSCRPSLLIADEPTTALDVTTEAQILKLLRKLQGEIGMAIMYITHNLGVIAQMADQVAVMYLGKVVEMADVDIIFYDPKHPYTQALLRSIPRLDETGQARLAQITGSIPDPYAIPKGCSFNPRCQMRIAGRCEIEEPQLIEVAPGHEVRCLLYS